MYVIIIFFCQTFGFFYPVFKFTFDNYYLSPENIIVNILGGCHGLSPRGCRGLSPRGCHGLYGIKHQNSNSFFSGLGLRCFMPLSTIYQLYRGWGGDIYRPAGSVVVMFINLRR